MTHRKSVPIPDRVDLTAWGEAGWDEATRLRRWIANHRSECPVMKQRAQDLFRSLAEEADAT